jgi:CSLREA domain-containing protein
MGTWGWILRRRGLLWAAATVLALATPARAATLAVNTTSDNDTPDDGICSLREAVAAVDAAPDGSDCGAADAMSNTIVLPASSTPYALTIPTGGSADNTTGDLDATGAVPFTVHGAGVAQTTVDASGLHGRILHVLAGADVTIEDLTLAGDHAVDGVDANTIPPGDVNLSSPGGDAPTAGQSSTTAPCS